MEASGEAANLSILDHNEAVYIDQVQCPRIVRIFAEIGRRVPLHSTACGKVLLAYLEPNERNRILAEHGLPARKHARQAVLPRGPSPMGRAALAIGVAH